jgi:hypothetical protein
MRRLRTLKRRVDELEKRLARLENMKVDTSGLPRVNVTDGLGNTRQINAGPSSGGVVSNGSDAVLKMT